jgi:hypothetical protein
MLAKAAHGHRRAAAGFTHRQIGNPSIAFMLIIERFLKADVVAKIGG